jgi:CRP/FNR family cyclic AMP-dependent transcriptional regulator
MSRIFCSQSTLRNVPLFSNVSDQQLATLVPALQHRTYRPRAVILRAGEIADGLYIVLSGHVRVLLDDGEGHQAIVALIGPNEFFGEVGLLDSGPRFTNVCAHQACELLYLPRKSLMDWLESDAGAALAMLRTVTGRLAEAQRKIGNLALMDVYGRVARLLLETARDSNGEWLVQAGSEQIAAMVGASREMVSRVVKDMITRGVVRRHKRKLIVLDRASLLTRTSRTRQRQPARVARDYTAAPA